MIKASNWKKGQGLKWKIFPLCKNETSKEFRNFIFLKSTKFNAYFKSKLMCKSAKYNK